MLASPSSFKGLLKKAQKVYDEAYDMTRETDVDGFIKIVTWNDIEKAVKNLSEMKGLLKIKIRELDKDKSSRNKYEKQLEKIIKLLLELREKQVDRNIAI